MIQLLYIFFIFIPEYLVLTTITLPPVWPHTFFSPTADSKGAVVSYWRKYVHEVLVNRLGGLSVPRKSVVRLTDRPDMTLDVYRGRKTTTQQQQQLLPCQWLSFTVRFSFFMRVYYLFRADQTAEVGDNRSPWRKKNTCIFVIEKKLFVK